MVNALAVSDSTFDVVDLHQVLQHIGDPIDVLREMRCVTEPNTMHEVDFSMFTWFPEVTGMHKWHEWHELYERVARTNGAKLDAGRRLHAWVHNMYFVLA